jgi:outer membrane autotransporter protein
VVAAINGATTAPGAFTLGARVAAGAYDYQLYDGGNAATGGDPNDQNWYLRSDYRPEVPLDAAIPALASRFDLDMLGTYHDRVGQDGVLDATADTADGTIAGQLSRLAGWGRLFGETGSGSLVSGGPGSEFGLSGFQTGVDLYRRAAPDRSQDSAGLYIGAGSATANVNQATGSAAGDLSISGYTLGGYWTHRGASGWYVDAVAQATRFDDVAASSGGQALTSNGWGLAASLEGGYPIALGHDLTLEPQAQAIFERVSLHGGQDAYGLIDFGDADPLYGRIGARLSWLWTLGNGGAIETWGRANLWRAFGAEASTTFATLSGADPVALATSLGGTWAQFGLGASSRITRNVAVFASGDCNLAVDGARGHSYDGRIGVKIAW